MDEGVWSIQGKFKEGDEIEIRPGRSVKEGNQIFESRFISGDRRIYEEIERLKEQFGGPERMARNIVFQRFYFEQYFRQRVRVGAINVKYCHGGSRDYLFLHWFNQLMKRKHNGWDQTSAERPVAEIGLSNLYKNGN